jgi:uncharacterized protein (UPF0261 family)
MEKAMSKKCVIVLGTLDTKGEEIQFLKQQLERRKCSVIVIDVSMGGKPSFKADVSPDEIARLGGKSIEEIRSSKDRDMVTKVMERGTMEKVKQLYAAGKVSGIMAAGGSTIALFGAQVMKQLPFGIPKIIVCPGVIPAHVRQLCATMDMILMQGVVDFAGLNELVKSILTRAAGAMCGMTSDSVETIPQLLEKSVAITQLGWSDNCARLVKQHLEKRGYRVYPFHAQGVGDRAMDDLITKGFFDGVIDIASAGVIEEIFRGTRSGGPKRLEAAGERGLPQVIAPGSINITNAGLTRRQSEKYVSREKKLKQDEVRVETRYNREELTTAAKVYAEKLNKARGPVRFLFPTRGWSSLDREGSVLHDPEEDRVFIEELRRNLKPEIVIEELDCHLEDAEFALALVEAFVLMAQSRNRAKR